MFKKVITRMLVLAGIFIAFLIVGVGAYWVISLQTGEASGPLVSIHSPENGSEVSAGDIITVSSSARDETRSIKSIELWAYQGGVMTLVNRHIPEGEDNSISLNQGWQPESPGGYRLIVQATNDQGASGQAAVDLQVLEGAAADADFYQEGEEYAEEESIAIQEEETWQPLPAGDPPEEDDPLPPDPDPSPPDPPLLFPVIFEILLEPFIPANLQGTWVEVEAVSFQVEEEYEELYCYVGFGEDTHRLPEIGSFHVSNTYEWNLPEYLGGDNKALVLVPENQALDLFLDCWGYETDSTLAWPGLYKAEHPPADWNGEIIEGHSTEGDGFSIAYRINPLGGSLPAPTDFNQIEINNRVLMTWNWDGDYQDINGYKIYRNNSIVASLPSDRFMIEVPPFWIVPPCGEEYTYTVVAYKAGEQSPPSNQLVYQGGICDGVDDIIQRTLQPTCDGRANNVKVNYQYYSLHGAASMDIRALKDGEIVDAIFSTRVPISHGHGAAYIRMSNFGSEVIQTDQLTFYLYDHKNMPFYVETVDHTINWGQGEPDLVITRAWVDLDDYKFNIRLRNDGCSGLAVTPLVSFVRESDGLTGFHQMDQNLRPGTQKLISIDLDPAQMGLWAGEISITADPLDKIVEANEDNNTYTIGEARIESVEFTKIDVYDNHAFWRGDWDVEYTACSYQQYLSDPPTIIKNHVWREKEYTLVGLTFNPVLSSTEPLIVKVRAWANYARGVRIPSSAMLYFSPDGNSIPALEDAGFTHGGSWKLGGDHSALGWRTDYRIYFRINLED